MSTTEVKPSDPIAATRRTDCYHAFLDVGLDRAECAKCHQLFGVERSGKCTTFSPLVHGQAMRAPPVLPALTDEQLAAIRWALLRLSPNWPREGERHIAALRELTRVEGSESPTSHNPS